MKNYHKKLIVTPSQMKMLEQETDKAGVSYERMMENAGVALAYNIKRLIKGFEDDQRFRGTPNVIFLCGNGNNAGDCFVAARHLKDMNIESKVFLLCGEPKTELAKLNFERMDDIAVVRSEERMIEILGRAFADIKVDGVFGTGFHGELPENIKNVFAHCKGITVACDVPSGGNCKTGAVADGMLKAWLTITFGARKIGMTQYPLKALCGDVKTAGIEIPDDVYEMLDYPVTQLDDEFVKRSLPLRKPDSHKGDFGRLLTVCGSKNMPGAAMMSAGAAARCGVGLLTVCTPAEYLPHFAAKLPEAVYLPLDTAESGTYTADSFDRIMKAAEKATAVLIGCGLGVSEDSRELVKKLMLNLNCPIILDADGINCITDCIDIIKQTRQEVILTPHPAEMARLCGVTAADIQSDRLEYARTFARENNCTVILKGAGTIVASPDYAFVNPTGNSGMSKGGSGDVLSGMIASLKAQGLAAAPLGVYLHGKAGDRAAKKYSKTSMLPTDMTDELGEIFKELGM